MLAGIYYPDEGTILIHGEEASIRSPKDAFDHGIGMIHQHFKLVDLFTAAENIALGIDDGGKYDLKAVAAGVKEISDKYGFGITRLERFYALCRARYKEDYDFYLLCTEAGDAVCQQRIGSAIKEVTDLGIEL